MKECADRARNGQLIRQATCVRFQSPIVATKKYPDHWGRWVQVRSRVVGFKRQQDLADAVGSGRTQLSKWLAMARPPKQMRRGFDDALARALKVDRRMLFADWSVLDPEVAPMVRVKSEEDVPWDAERPVENEIRGHIQKVLLNLRSEDLQRVLVFASGCALDEMNRRRIQLEQGLERLAVAKETGKWPGLPRPPKR